MIPQAMQTFQYGAAIKLVVQFIDPVATAANNNVPVPLNIAGAIVSAPCFISPRCAIQVPSS